MLNLKEFADTPKLLADYLPWACLVAPGVVLNKDGSFQRSFTFRGPDLESATEAELVSASARANNVLKRFGTGWALFFEAVRREALDYPVSRFPDPVSWLVDAERRAAFEAEGRHFESRYFGTLVWMPPADSSDAAGRALVERDSRQEGRDWHASLASFAAKTDRALDLLAGFMPDVHPLDDTETLTYLHATISTRPHVVRAPDTPVYLDAILAESDIVSIHVPGGERTVNLVDAGFLDLMKPNSILLNTSRGEVVDEEALLDAIESKGIRAGLDVFRNEPGDSTGEFTSRLAAHPSVVGTHHIGASTQQAQDATSAGTIDVIEAYRAGDPTNCVNVVRTRVGTTTITIRHFDRVGVLAAALSVLRKADINVQTMANKVFEGSNAAMAIIDVSREVTEDVSRQLAALDNVIQVQTRERDQ